jgi:hypothetical protein
MPIAIAFWVLMLLWLIFGVVVGPTPFSWRGSAGNLLLFVLIALLGWHVFGAALK